MKRYLILLLILTLALTSCTSSHTVGDWPTGSTTPSETEPPSEEPVTEYTALNALPEKDMEGATVVITATDTSPFLSGGQYMYDAAVSARNAAVGKKYNATVAVTQGSWDKIYNELSSAKSEGRFYSDILAIPLYSVGRFARSGLIKDLSGVEGINKDADYYVKTDAFVDLGATYAYMCDSVSSGYGYGVFFNEHLASEKGIDFYSMVKEGTWTWDKLLESAEGMNGAGFTYGDPEQFVDAVITSCGLVYTDYSDGVRSADYTGEFADEVMALATKVYASALTAKAEEPAALFEGGGCLFYIAPLSEAMGFATMKDSYGVLPLPTLKGGTEYKTYMSPDTPVLCIPEGPCASENAPYILEALAAASCAEMESEYLLHLANFALHSEDAVRCAALIEQSCTYDYVYVFGPLNDPVANCTYWVTRMAVMEGADHASIYKTYHPMFEQFVNKM